MQAANAATYAPTFVLVTRSARGAELWQVNGKGPRMTVGKASQVLSDMAPRPARGATILDAHRAFLAFEIVDGAAERVQAVAFSGRGIAGGWMTREEWHKADRLLSTSPTGKRPAL